MTKDVDILTPALEQALAAWGEWRKGKALIFQYEPGQDILGPLAVAIEQCEVYKAVTGRAIFSGYSGVVVHASALASPLLFRSEPERGLGTAGAIDWLQRILSTPHAVGTYAVAVWGLTPTEAIRVGDGIQLLPYDAAPDSPLKRRIADLARSGWPGVVWHSARFYDTPGAILTQTVQEFPYLGGIERSFAILDGLDSHTRDFLAFLQASLTGTPIVGASWFSYEDDTLDFNSHENHLSWCVPEVEPVIRENVNVAAESLATALNAFHNIPTEYREALTRSSQRFALSQCRHGILDRILDLAIAFEILTSNKGEFAPPGLKVSIRSAQLIGGGLDRRRRIRDCLSDLYRRRNASTHGGSIKAEDIAKEEANFAECSAIYRNFVDSILTLRQAPDWSVLDLEPRVRE